MGQGSAVTEGIELLILILPYFLSNPYYIYRKRLQSSW